MAERWFLKLDGIAGESTDSAHKDEIDIDAWSFGVTNSSSAGGGGGGGGAGRATFQDFHFVSRISKASPALFLACASGSHIKEGQLSGARGAGKSKGTDFLKYKLRDIVVTSHLQSGSADSPPTEQFSLNFTKIEWSFIPQLANGKFGPPVSAGWNVKASKKL